MPRRWSPCRARLNWTVTVGFTGTVRATVLPVRVGLRCGREVGGVVAGGGAGGGVDRVEGEVELVGVDAAVGVDGVEGAGPVAGEGGGCLGVDGGGGAEQEECHCGDVGEGAVGHLSLAWGLRFCTQMLVDCSLTPHIAKCAIFSHPTSLASYGSSGCFSARSWFRARRCSRICWSVRVGGQL